MKPPRILASVTVIRAREASIARAVKRVQSENAAPAAQLTPWEAVIMDDGNLAVKAQFKAPFGRKTWHTLFEQAYVTGNGKAAHDGYENAVRIARAMNLAYPCHEPL